VNTTAGSTVNETVYDNPVGVFNLLNSPKIYVYENNITTGIPRLSKQYKLEDGYDPKYVFNSAAGFTVEPEDVKFQLVFDDCTISQPGFSPSLVPTDKDDRFTTPLMPINCLSDYSVGFIMDPTDVTYYCDGEPRLRVVATLSHDELGSTTTYVATYNFSEIIESEEPLPSNPYSGVPNTPIIEYENFDPIVDIEAWGQVTVQNVPVTILIDPNNPNIQTLLDYETHVPGLGVVESFPGDKEDTYHIVFEGKPPCPYTQPASESEIADFCTNTYDPVASLEEEQEGPLSLKAISSGSTIYDHDFVLKLFPQPSADWVTLELPDGYDQGRLFIRNAYGQAILSRAIQSSKTELDIASLPSGLYIVSVDLMNNQQPISQRLIKQ
jgi:hypothetical protein